MVSFDVLVQTVCYVLKKFYQHYFILGYNVQWVYSNQNSFVLNVLTALLSLWRCLYIARNGWYDYFGIYNLWTFLVYYDKGFFFVQKCQAFSF